MPQNITTFAQAHAALDRYRPDLLQRPTYTLEFIQRVMDFLGNPQDSLRVIHIAGTSGKTSTAYYIAGLLQGTGKKVGLSVSPHLIELNERVQINLVPLPEKQFCEALEQFLHLVEKSGVILTRFEILAAFEYWYFAAQRVDYAVIETGMGGLLDATNTVTRADKLCVITDIGMDHVATLGPGLTDIAQHKAGIIQSHNTVFCYRQQQPVMAAITTVAQRRQADLHVLDPTESEESFAFLPTFQRRNLGLAHAAAAWVINPEHDLPASILAKAAYTLIPGRMQTIEHDGKTIILDGAHNPQKMQALREAVRQRFGGQKLAILAAFARGDQQRLAGNAKELAGFNAPIIVTAFASTATDPHQSFDPEAVGQALKNNNVSVVVIPDLPLALAALMARPEPVLLVTGSLYLLGRVQRQLDRLKA